MKKSDSKKGLLFSPQFFKIMNIYIALALVSLAEIFATDIVYSQVISIDVKDLELKYVLTEIETKSDFYFFYNGSLINTSVKVSVRAQNEDVETILTKILHETDIDYKRYRNQIVLYSKNTTATLEFLEDISDQNKTKNTSHLVDQQSVSVIKKAVQDPLTGKVVDEDGYPLPGVSIIIQGTNRGTQTDFDGNYEIIADPEDVLVFSYIGMATQTITLGTIKTLDVVMETSLNELDEVVVTSFGVKREKKALGYAVTELDSESVKNRPEMAFGKVLQGKLAGVQISVDSGATGDDVDINIRSRLSIDQDNEPLIVINGVYFGGDYRDIDPNNIKSISVLKGLNAALLYGSEGRNGVILIETLSSDTQIGKKHFSVNASHTSYINKVAGLPEYQNKYGIGSDFGYSLTYGSWGPAFDTMETVDHPYAQHADLFPEFLNATTPYRPYNNVEEFFRTGHGTTTSVQIASSQENTAFNVSIGYSEEEGVIETNRMDRFNLAVGGHAKLSDQFSLSANIDYVFRKYHMLPSTILSRVMFLPRSLDLSNLPFQNPSTGENIYYRNWENPYWTLHNVGEDNEKVGIFGNVKLDYRLSDVVDINYTVGIESGTFDEFDYRNKGGYFNQFGEMETSHFQDFVLDQRLLVSLSNIALGKQLGFDGFVGFTSNHQRGYSSELTLRDQIVYGFFRPKNFRSTTAEYDSERENFIGVFGQLGFTYDDAIYMTFSARNDRGSTVEPENQQLFYPGVSISVLPTSLFDFNTNKVNYLKIRAAYATSSGYPEAYNTRSFLETDERRFVLRDGTTLVSNGVDEEAANPNLSPELHKEFEVGLEGSFFNNRLQLEISAFERQSKDQILERNYDPSTGVEESTINVGRVDTRGLEVELDADIIKGKNWRFHQRGIFSSYTTEVIDIPQSEIRLGTTSRFAIKGEELGVIKGSYFLRDDVGNYLIHPETGELMISNEYGFDDKILGSPLPDFTFTSISSIQYKNLQLTAQWEWIKGGLMQSGYVETIIERGVSRDTENREGSFVIPGVYGNPETGTAFLDNDNNPTPNTIQLNANRTIWSNYYASDEGSFYDATVFRLRELALSYGIDKKDWPKLPFDHLNITLSGQNLWYHAPHFPRYINFDPEHDGGLGDSRETPTNKRFSLGVSIRF
jgi:TonB-linked SusC/RagA family outer membrane protein